MSRGQLKKIKQCAFVRETLFMAYAYGLTGGQPPCEQG